jgi:hypothetical protein
MDNDETTEKPRSTLTNLRRETGRSTGSTVAATFMNHSRAGSLLVGATPIVDAPDASEP